MKLGRDWLNIASGLLLQVVQIGVGLVVPAVIIQSFGSSANGLVGSVRQFIGYLFLADTGVGLAAMAALYGPLANRDLALARSVLGATRHWYVRSGWVFAACVVALCFVYPAFPAAGEVEPHTAVFTILILGPAALIEYVLLSKYRSLLAADRRLYTISLAHATVSLASMGSVVLLANRGSSLLTVLLVMTVITTSRVLFVILYARRIYPEFTPWPTDHSWRIPQRSSAFVQQVASVVVFGSPVAILTLLVPLSEVSVYLVYSVVFGAITSLLSTYSSAMLGRFGQLSAASDKGARERAFRWFERSYYAVAVWAYACTFLLVEPFLRVYTARFIDAEYVRPELPILFTVVGLANSLRVPHNLLITAEGHFDSTRSRAIAEAALNVGASVLFVLWLGMPGVLLGAVVSFAYRSVDIVIYSSRRILGSPVGRSTVAILAYVVVGCAAVAAFHRLVSHVVVSGYAQWFALAVSVAVSIAIVVGAVWFGLTRRSRVHSM